MIEELKPDIDGWGDPKYLKIMNKINELILNEERNFQLILSNSNEMKDMLKELEYLKKAIRNR